MKRTARVAIAIAALPLLGAHCPWWKHEPVISEVAVVIDKDGARGTAIVDGQKREAAAPTAGELWPKLGLSGSLLPEIGCVNTPGDETIGQPTTDTPPGGGTRPAPWPDDAKYPGSKGGGCGTWAALQCDDILDGQSRPVTPERWKKTHGDIGESPNGGSSQEPTDEYHRKRIDGCSRSELLKPGDVDTIWLLKGKHCDCKVWMVGPTSGHVEVITGVTRGPGGKKCLETNSWGKKATVCGGDKDNGDDYSHSEDRPGGHFGKNSPHWPPGQTRVRWSCVCPAGNCT